MIQVPRRRLLGLFATAALARSSDAWARQAPPRAVPESFPTQQPDLVREVVGASHANPARVRELLGRHATLANAAWDWGFGDWETALGAASHTGNREIAGMLLAAGARPSLFSAAMLGHLNVVKAFVEAEPGIQKTRGPHGISLLAHARAGGEASSAVVKYLESLGDADPRYTNLPLSEADRNALLGEYGFGADPRDRLMVTITDRGMLRIGRQGVSPQNLFHQGDRVFHTPGAPAIRIRFDRTSPAASVEIIDGDMTLVATRRAA